MIKTPLLSLFFCLFVWTSIYAQEIDDKKYINKIHKEYVEKLGLNNNQTKGFKSILKKHNAILKTLLEQKKDTREINKQIKLLDLEVYKILTREQFSEYKRIKLQLEDYKKYRY
ncbi:hypothetical protein AAON49_00215 [Pseudotenacibaculum sp. MALMAid0570]|uniref:hypothetical protein n=1 Tax=Pseudotenacibaculum sp. MALMAid0570 TaxID=3143938 RepID=UPI0032E03E28